jgi:coatomer subunit beta'
MYSATGNLAGMRRLAKAAAEGGKTNVAFMASILTANGEACVELLISTKRLPKAAFFVRTYMPSRIDEIVTLWKQDLSTVSETAASALACPSENPELFPDMEIALQVEKIFLGQRDATAPTGIPAADYLTAKDDLDLNLIALIKGQSGQSQPQQSPEAESKVPEPERMMRTQRKRRLKWQQKWRPKWQLKLRLRQHLKQLQR